MTTNTETTPADDSATSTGSAVEADPDRVQHLDPRTLLLDANVRHHARLTRAFVASVRDYGVLQAIQAVVTADGRARVRFGHRRALAAIAAGSETVPVIVHPSAEGHAEAERLSAQYIENTEREGLAPVEQLDVFAGLADLGMSAGQIATATKARRRDVVDGLRAARSAEVREVVELSALTLEQGATLQEFSDDPEAYQALHDAATGVRGYGPSFVHLAARLRQDRLEATARAELLADLEQDRVRVIDRPDFASAATRLIDLTDAPDGVPGESDEPVEADRLIDRARSESDPEDLDEDLDEDGGWEGEAEEPTVSDERDHRPAPITPEEHARCPGHAAYLTTDYSRRRQGPVLMAMYVCVDPAANGHRSRVGHSLRCATATTAPRGGETTEQAAAREEAARAEKRVQRARVIAGNRAWVAAESVRREFVAELLTRRTPPKGACQYVAATLAAHRYTIGRAAERGHEMAAELLFTQPAGVGERGAERIMAMSRTASASRADVIILGMVLGAIEGETSKQSWRWIDAHQGCPDESLVSYLGFLTSCGYEMAPIERLAVGHDIDPGEVFDLPTKQARTTEVAADQKDDTAQGGEAGPTDTV